MLDDFIGNRLRVPIAAQIFGEAVTGLQRAGDGEFDAGGGGTFAIAEVASDRV